MNRKNTTWVLAAVLIVSATGLILNANVATAGLRGSKILDQTGCQRCPECDHQCNFKAEQVDDEKSCFEVEKKVICIPRVVFPWQTGKNTNCGSCDSCDGSGCSTCNSCNNGARTREINVLKTKKYKCPKCKYSWSAEKKPCGSGCGCAGACDGGCDATYPSSAPTGAYEVITPAYSTPSYSLPASNGLEAVDVDQHLPSPATQLPAPATELPAPVAH
ncbi:MAG: hypothetical protein AB8B91_13265 [Rubripirellula sp.]